MTERITPEEPDAAVSLALDIDWLVKQVDEKTRESALDIVWFFYIGRRMEWTPRRYGKGRSRG